MPVVTEPFGSIAGRQIDRYRLSHDSGIEVCVIPYGAIIQAVNVPDSAGNAANVVLGFQNPADYETNAPYFGVVAGRYANRIANARFELDGEVIQLVSNEGAHQLHGGPQGFSRRMWDTTADKDSPFPAITMRLLSPDGDQGYPGNLEAFVTYALPGPNVLSVTYHAKTDRPTVVNLTQHAYFNLAGESSGDVYRHELQIVASRYTPIDKTLIPDGSLIPVDATPFDFREPKAIGQDIRTNHPQMLAGKGYDHNFALDRPAGSDGELIELIRIADPSSGRRLSIHTTEPGVQFYSGNFMNGIDVGTGGSLYRQGDGFALETQHFPDSPNKSDFPSTVLRPNEEYHSRTEWHFSW